jgi:hypothetical protein
MIGKPAVMICFVVTAFASAGNSRWLLARATGVWSQSS